MEAAAQSGLLDGELAHAGAAFSVTMLVLLFVDTAFRRMPRLASDHSARYFALHALLNAYVVVAHADDVLQTLLNPAAAHLRDVNLGPTGAIAAIHVYHALRWRPLPWVDWAHHVIMVGGVIPLSVLVNGGGLQGFGAFWVCGLPGGLDYAMLVAVRCGWIEPLTEKRLNSHLQLWLRAPGCVAHAVLVWAAQVDRVAPKPVWSDPLTPAALVMVAAFFWNGLYFLGRVLRSEGRALAALERAQEKKCTD
jgi:hypothetical protein